MVEAPRPAVAIVLLRDDGRMLMIRRAEGIPKAGLWSPPTGRVEPGESAAEAARREAREELGLAVTPLRQVWTSLTDDARYRLDWWWVRAESAPLRPDRREVAELRWVSSEEFPALQPRFVQHQAFFDGVLPMLRSEPSGDDSEGA